MDIAKFLNNKELRGRNSFGECKYCGEDVQWRRNKLTNHFVYYCRSVPSEAQEFFKRQKLNENKRIFSLEMDIAKFLNNKELRGQNSFGECKYCGEDVQWRRNKLTNHFVYYCRSVPSEAQEFFKRQKLNENNRSTSVSSDTSPSQSVSNVGSDSLAITNIGRRIDKVNSDMKDKLDASIARFFYRTEIPINVADCKEWKNIWSLARPAYTPPSSKKLRKTLSTNLDIS